MSTKLEMNIRYAMNSLVDTTNGGDHVHYIKMRTCERGGKTEHTEQVFAMFVNTNK